MYYISQTELFYIDVFAFAVGAVLGVLWDVMRISRLSRDRYGREGSGRAAKAFRRLLGRISDVMTFFEDILFFVISAVTVCIFLYQANSGKIRLMALFFVLAGFFTYYFTVGHIVISLSEKIIFAVRKIADTVYKYTVYRLILLAKTLIRRIFEPIRKKHLTNRTKSYIKNMRDEAKNGFKEKNTVA